MLINKLARDIVPGNKIFIDGNLVTVLSIVENPNLLGDESFDVTYSKSTFGVDTISLYGWAIVKELID